jgi:hypothetical protein
VRPVEVTVLVFQHGGRVPSRDSDSRQRQMGCRHPEWQPLVTLTWSSAMTLAVATHWFIAPSLRFVGVESVAL